MTGSPRRSSWLAIAMVLALVAGVMVGCSSSPQERYRVLSMFFDGVPDPDAPKQVATVDEEEGGGGGEKGVVTASIVTVHKPYKDKQCAACHRSANGDMEEFEKAYDACIKCHKKVPSERKLMHGPVAREACRFCHAPHESNEPALLKDTPIKVCTQCHDKSLLGNFPQQHVDGVTSCLSCHFGHGGDARNFLKPDQWPLPPADAQTQPGTWPTTHPAPPPATAPSTQPAPQLHLQQEAQASAEGASAGARQTLVLAAGSAGEAGMRLGSGWRRDPSAPRAQERVP